MASCGSRRLIEGKWRRRLVCMGSTLLMPIVLIQWFSLETSMLKPYSNPQQRRPSSSVSAMKNKTDIHPPTARICWMGVVEDWKNAQTRDSGFHQSTLETIFQPLLHAGYQLDIYLALAKQKSKTEKGDFDFPPFREPYSFTNKQAIYDRSMYVNQTLLLSDRAKKLYKTPYQTHPADQDGNEAEIEFDRTIARLKEQLLAMSNNHTRLSIAANLYPALINPPIPVELVLAMAIRDGLRLNDSTTTSNNNTKGRSNNNKKKKFKVLSRESFGRILWRSVNEMRMLHCQYECGQYWFGNNQEHTATTSNPNDILIRLGDDTQLTNADIIENTVLPFLKQRQDPPFQDIATARGTLLAFSGHTKRGHDNDQIEIVLSSKDGTTTTTKLFYDYLTTPHLDIYKTAGSNFFWKKNDANKNEKSRTVRTMSDYYRMIYQSVLHLDVLMISSDTQQADQNFVALPISQDKRPLEQRQQPSSVAYPLPTAPYVHPQSNRLFVGPNEGKKTALVCITGQVERLELKNKLETLITPMSHEYQAIDLVLVLTPGNAVYQIHKKPSKSSSNRNTGSSFATSEEVWEYLQNADNRHLFRNVTIHIFEPDPNLPINPQYALQKGRSWGYDANTWSISMSRLDQTLQRIVANTKMMQGYRYCYNEQLANQYDLYVRIRDDVGFSKPIPPELYSNKGNQEQHSGGSMLLTSYFRNNGGLNDRFAFVQGTAATLCYFHLPFVELYSGNVLETNMINTESYFKRVYLKYQRDCQIDKFVTIKDRAMDAKKMHLEKFLD